MNTFLLTATLILSLGAQEESFFEFSDTKVVKGQIHRSHLVYDYCTASLHREESRALDSLYQFLINNPKVSIEIGCHSDWRGSDLYNTKLTTRRASSIVNYLKSKNINPKRLVAKGYGEAKPIHTQEELEEIPENEREVFHYKNRRTEFTIINTDEEFIGLDCIDHYDPAAEAERAEEAELKRGRYIHGCPIF